MDKRFIEQGSVTSPRGFRAAGVTCGLKVSGKPDVALIVSESPAVAAGVFTTNQVHAYNIDRNRARLADDPHAQAILINAGNANAMTGRQGMEDTEASAAYTAELLGLEPTAVLTSSTGVIGVKLDMAKLRRGIEQAVAALSPDGGLDAATAIMTTDTRPKHLAVQVELDGRTVTIGGMAKGAGMIHPNMATLLAYVTTDAAIRPELLQAATTAATDVSFNMITVDGDTSTSDSLIVLANGQAGNRRLESAEDPDYPVFASALELVLQHLAREIARDGEGATKLLTVQVCGAETEADARQIARTVAGSNLFKCAIFGADPNWGRIAAAAGRAGVEFQVQRLNITLNGLPLVQNGEPLDFDHDDAVERLKRDEIVVDLDLQSGAGQATAWGCDLTLDYVKINAEYFT